jgi:biuret amidohydrolase
MPVATDALVRTYPRQELSAMLDASRTALIVIDVQIDFAAPDGAMGRIGLDIPRTEAAIDQIDKLIAAARAAAVPVVFARVVTRPETDSKALRAFMQRLGRDPDRSVAICRAGESGSDYYRVAPESRDLEIEKVLFSSFVGTDLDAQLRARGVDTLMLCGLTTDCCVDCTARDGFHRDFNIFIAADACAAFDVETHEAALSGLTKNCAIALDADAVVACWTDAGA